MPIRPSGTGLQAVPLSFIMKERGREAVGDHTQMLVELMQKTIEQKDGQIRELQKTIENLQATVANINETIEEFRRKFFGSTS